MTTTNQLNNDLFFDQSPLRNAQEGVKKLARRLDSHVHQLGFVAFSAHVLNNPRQRAKLQCLRWAENFGDPDGAAKCYDPATSPISFTAVISGIENQDNNGSTNIAEGMREGLEELGVNIPGFNQDVDSACTGIANDQHACDRGANARKFLILITDGAPSGSSAICPATFEWLGVDGRGIPAYNCAMWYALQAADNKVIVYTIGIAPDANADLLTAMATGVDPGTGDVYFDSLGGQYYLAAQPSDLDPIYDAILPQVTDCQVSSYLPLILK
ncbi:MAG: VWA domain-containing protein [Chloroflexi bacterium]|nr:VWA domain-containing protein [Chloroflexota bacterium]